MVMQLADYEITRAVAGDAVLPCLSASRPARLGGGLATVWVLGPLGRVPFGAAKARLEAVAAVRNQYLPDWLELGTGEWQQRPVLWASAATEVTATLSSSAPPLGLAARTRALAAAARGAHALHERGLLHAGICPEAVALVGPSRPGALTPAGNALGAQGTPGETAVLAPPPLADGRQPLLYVGYPPLSFIDPLLLRGEGGRWSDIWAIGAVARFVATGQAPFPGLDSKPVVAALAELLAVPTPEPADLPRALAGVVSSCMARDPESRPATCDEVANRLLEAAAALGDA
jgi:serine/threonine protein kinase